MKVFEHDTNKIAVIGVPSSAGARRTGQESAPEWFRNARLIESLEETGREVADFGDLPLVRYRIDPDHLDQQNPYLVAGVIRQLADRVSRAIASGYTPFVIGGDCTITIGAAAGCLQYYPELALMYLDADIDFNLPEESPSGILDGMVLALITGHGNAEVSRASKHYPLMAEENIFAFGYNDRSGFIDTGEMKRFQQSAIHKYPLDQIHNHIAEAASEALEVISAGAKKFLLHFDVDVLVESEFPVADVPHCHGMNLRDALAALQIFLHSPNCVGFVLTEFNAERDPNGFYSRKLVNLISGALRS